MDIHRRILIIKKHKKLFFFIILSISILAIISSFVIVNIHNRLYDSSKPNIIEIPGTANNYVGVDSGKTYYDYYFMVQQYPNNDDEIQALVDEFIKENLEFITNESVNSSSSVALHFMKPSFYFPVYFEENESYFTMDDYAVNYLKTNEIVKVIFRDEPDNYKYMFQHNNY